MKNTCKICGRNCEGDYCFQHKPRKAFPVGLSFKKPVYDGKQKPVISEMNLFFLKIWNKRKHVSEISGERLFSPPSSSYFHHILPKEKYPELKLLEDNIIIVSLDEHTNVESDMYKYEEINKRREILKKKYL